MKITFGISRDDDKKKDDGPSEDLVAPNTQIRYDANLIDKLESDHQVMLGTYTEVLNLANAGKYKKIPELLKQFRSAFNAHILLENVKLYLYLKYCLQSSPDSYEVMLEMKNEMQTIGKTVSIFLKKYIEPEWDAELEKSFQPELEAVGAALVERIENEETVLYALYLPPGNY